MQLKIRPLKASDWISISKIYEEGIATGIATFETEVPNWADWDKKYIESCRIVAELNGLVVGFAVLSKVSNREVYKGVAEVSVYVSKKQQRQGIGKMLLMKLIEESENQGFWTLQAGIFSDNVVSIDLHKKCGFRVVGIKDKIGQLHGVWHDNHYLERRSNKIGIK